MAYSLQGPTPPRVLVDDNIHITSVVEAGTMPANGSITLMTSSQAGYITLAQIAIIGTTNAVLKDTTITLNIDSGKPGAYTTTCDTGSFFMIHTANSPIFQQDTINVQANDANSRMGGTRKVFIPFNYSCTLTLTNGDAVNAGTIYSQIYYANGSPTYLQSGTRRKRWKCALNKNVAVLQYAATTLLNVSNVAGQLESVYLLFYGSTNISALEGNVLITIDGVSNAYSTGGTEDYFGGQYYWETAGGVATNLRSNNWGLVNQQLIGANSVLNSAYRFHGENDPINWNSSITFVWNNGQNGEGAAPGNTTIIALITYWTAS